MTKIIHHRYKSSEVAEHYRTAKDFGLPIDKYIKMRLKPVSYPVYEIDRNDVFPRGGVTILIDEKGNMYESICSFNDNYDRRRGVKICIGRMEKANELPF